MRHVRLLLTAAVLAAAAAGAAAQMYSPGYGSYGAPMSSFLASSYLVQQVGSGTRLASSRAAAAKPAPVQVEGGALRVPAGAAPIAPRRLAEAYPPAARAEAERYFLQALRGYGDIESRLGLPRHDLAGAVATFIAGNLIALRDRELPDAHFQSLVRQMRASLAGVDALRDAPDAEKQELYEQLAIVGTTMALTREGLKQRPDPRLAAGLRAAAQQYLEQFLKVDSARIAVGAQGLVLE